MFKNLLCGLAITLVGAAYVTKTHAQTEALIPDTQIAKIVMTIDEGEIDLGKVAKKHAQNQEVKAFATMMVDRHEAGKKELKRFAKKNNIKPEDSVLAKSLEDETEKAEKDLKRQEKSAFDRAYIQSQITMHEKALSTLRDSLIPSAQNTAFKTHLEKVATHVAEHLEHAKTIQTKIQ